MDDHLSACQNGKFAVRAYTGMSRTLGYVAQDGNSWRAEDLDGTPFCAEKFSSRNEAAYFVFNLKATSQEQAAAHI